MTTAPEEAGDLGPRGFYEKISETADSDFPSFEDLTPEQLHLWILACASCMEYTVRMTDALRSVGMGITP